MVRTELHPSGLVPGAKLVFYFGCRGETDTAPPPPIPFSVSLETFYKKNFEHSGLSRATDSNPRSAPASYIKSVGFHVVSYLVLYFSFFQSKLLKLWADRKISPPIFF